MAGDIGVAERLLADSQGIALGAGEAVLHEYGPRVRIGMGTEIAPPAGAPPPDARTAPVAVLTHTEQLGLAAFQHRQSPRFLQAKSKRLRGAKMWGHFGAKAEPVHRHRGPSRASGAGVAAGAGPRDRPTSERLTGRVAVGLILVSGSVTKLRLTQGQQIKIVAESQNGLSWLGSRSPAQDVTWVHEITPVTVDVPEVRRGKAFEVFEKPWRDAALRQLGLPHGRRGLTTYVQDLRSRLRTDWAYCVLFTRYRLFHFAYADSRGPSLVMHYANDGWGPSNIDRVFAHETGHIFGAPDEYSDADCNCRGRHGFFKKRNGNCGSCAPDGGVDCIMRENTWEMCSFTFQHLGFNGTGETS